MVLHIGVYPLIASSPYSEAKKQDNRRILDMCSADKVLSDKSREPFFISINLDIIAHGQAQPFVIALQTIGI